MQQKSMMVLLGQLVAHVPQLKLICTLLELKQQVYGVVVHLLVQAHMNMMVLLGQQEMPVMFQDIMV